MGCFLKKNFSLSASSSKLLISFSLKIIVSTGTGLSVWINTTFNTLKSRVLRAVHEPTWWWSPRQQSAVRQRSLSTMGWWASETGPPLPCSGIDFDTFLILAGWLCFSEINRVRVSLFHHQNKKDLCLPEPLGPVVTLQEKLFVPIKDHPDVSPSRALASGMLVL